MLYNLVWSTSTAISSHTSTLHTHVQNCVYSSEAEISRSIEIKKGKKKQILEDEQSNQVGSLGAHPVFSSEISFYDSARGQYSTFYFSYSSK